MNTTQPITKLATALLKAQKEMGAAKKGAENPFFHSRYADLSSIMEACKGPLNDNGITILQPVGCDESGQYVETILLHESGEYISDKMRLIPGNKPQEQGSAISYARRYSLQSLVFIPAEDDDGNLASKQPSQVVSQKPKEDSDFPPAHPSDEGYLGDCEKCGAPLAVSKAGNTYCTAKCWLK